MIKDSIFENELYEIANEIVGIAGKNSDRNYNEYGEEFIEFAMYITNIDKEEIITRWKSWIKSYMEFSKYQFKGSAYDTEKPLRIFWRARPEIIGKTYGEVVLYARLCISNNTLKTIQALIDENNPPWGQLRVINKEE